MMTYSQYLLMKLMEECAEVTQRASKQSLFGQHESQPGDSRNNAVRLREEVNDMLVIVKILEEEGLIPTIIESEMKTFEEGKRERLTKYLNYSRSLGFVE